ncbi:hypothetical protein [Streptomyces sp. TLI_185]|uniref:hypothetical protein n=1 Tax=Streptomyces sp. TLI_185 TaxID=2485151 RepID=UPI000F4D54C1|nr:hypothetical protein [Streptomyces sp. TLI_185]RPF33428.1 hypothetical protein EDD92_3340 [Streptomyces sp. TLI_185]
MTDNSRCDIEMITEDHHSEAVLMGGLSSGAVHALLAVDDSLRALVALQERQTAALERLAEALEGRQAAIPRPRTAA